jgi:hypothetical protein
MTYGIEKTSPGLGQTQKGGGVKPFNGIQTNDKKPSQTCIHSKRPNTKKMNSNIYVFIRYARARVAQ